MPFLVACGLDRAVLKLCDVLLPFSLSRQSGKVGHCLVPFEIERRVDNHDEVIGTDVYFHFKDANLLDAIANLAPEMFGIVGFTVAANKFVVVLEVHHLHIALGGLCVLLAWISVSLHKV